MVATNSLVLLVTLVAANSQLLGIYNQIRPTMFVCVSRPTHLCGLLMVCVCGWDFTVFTELYKMPLAPS